jgi:glycine cleavage system H protein
MTVLLVVLTAIILLSVDYFYGRKRLVAEANPVSHFRPSMPRLQPPIVDGFEVPDNLRYHPGHSWALSESPNLVRAGLDMFAARLIGKIDRITLPQRGHWVRQGQKIWTFYRDGNKVEMASPIEGIVTDVNDAVTRDPELARRDPYGDGWLMKVQAPDAKINIRNLLGGAVGRKWMEEAAQRLRGRLPALAGAVAQDGGLIVDDLTAALPAEEWSELTHEFFLT